MNHYDSLSVHDFTKQYSLSWPHDRMYIIEDDLLGRCYKRTRDKDGNNIIDRLHDHSIIVYNSGDIRLYPVGDVHAFLEMTCEYLNKTGTDFLDVLRQVTQKERTRIKSLGNVSLPNEPSHSNSYELLEGLIQSVNEIRSIIDVHLRIDAQEHLDKKD